MSSDSKLAHFEPVKETLAKYKDQIDAIRKQLTDGLEEKDDVIVYRFLRGYQFDVDAAAAALLKTLKWRKEHKVDEIAAKISKIAPENFPYFEKMQRVNPQNLHHGSDKKGQPIVYAKAGKSDPGLLTKILTEDQLLENLMYQMEYKRHVLGELTKEKGVVMRSLRIVDLTGLGRKHLAPKALRTLRGVIALVQDHYPELVGNIVYVNVPWVFTSIWALVKPWINPATLEKITITGRNAQETLATFVDAKDLPKYLGGECECKDKGGCVPEPDPDEGFTKISVSRASAQEVTIDVPPSSEKDTEFKGPYLVNWEFRTESNNIDFEVIFKPKTGSPEEVVKKERVDSHLKIIEGGFEAKSPGSVIFNFDNKFSWTYSKTVLYRIEVGLKEVKVEGESETTSTSTTSSTSTSTESTSTSTSTESTSTSTESTKSS